jgi:hypothetical protein
MLEVSNIKLSGELHLVLTDENGAVKDERHIRNLVVTQGKGWITDRLLAAPGQGAVTHMGVGTGVVAAAAGDINLGTALNARVVLTSTTRVTDTTTFDAIEYVCAFGTGSWVGAITEAILALSITSGNNDAIARTVFAAINKTTNDTLTITWRIKTTAS